MADVKATGTYRATEVKVTGGKDSTGQLMLK